jgi:hypothetical protein
MTATASDLNRRNEFARRTPRGLYLKIDYSEAFAALRRGEPVFERVLPERSYTLKEKATISWTPVVPPSDTRPTEEIR